MSLVASCSDFLLSIFSAQFLLIHRFENCGTFCFLGGEKKLACSLGSNGGSLPVLLRGKREGWQGVGTIGSYWGVLPKSATEMALPKINLFDINF